MASISSSALVALILSLLLLWDPTPALAKWQTLSGQAPIVIASGGLSGLYPGQTRTAYYNALYSSLTGVVISCDLQLAKASVPKFAAIGQGICRTNLNLADSTNIDTLAPQLTTTRIVNGQNVTGYFAVDIPYADLTGPNATAFGTRSSTQRSEAFDGMDPIATPDQMPQIITAAGLAQYSTWWLNSENTRWIEENSNINATLNTILEIESFLPGYASVPEIKLLQTIGASPNTSSTKLIYKFMDGATVDASTNQTYTSLLKNLTYLAPFANGILVPKYYIWPIDPTTLYLASAPTTLVQDAHKAGLEVYVYDFANDLVPDSNLPNSVPYNYSFDPITEVLNFIETYNFSVDGFFTDFPVTASEAISCYASNSRNTSAQDKAAALKKPTLISHNGYSGRYPASTSLAYTAAIAAKVDYIDCSVQISKDSVLFCRPTVNLVDSTDISTNNDFLQYLAAYPGLNDDAKGLYPFALTWAQISTAHATTYNPHPTLPRDPNYNGQFGFVTFADFLALAKNSSIGALVDIQNAVYLRDNQNLSVVDAVVAALSAAGYNSTDKVIMQSDDSAALARLRELNITYPMMFEAIYTDNDQISLTAVDIAQIKQYADSVNFYTRLVEPFDSNYFLAKPSVDVIALAHQQNLTVYYSTQQNEFLSLAFDYQDDPSMEINSLLSYGIDGLITDYPPTVQNFLDNQCITDAKGLSSTTVNFSIPVVTRGVLSNSTFLIPAPAPAPGFFPNLVVPEPPLAGPNAPAPEPAPSSASQISMHFLVAAVSVLAYFLVVL